MVQWCSESLIHQHLLSTAYPSLHMHVLIMGIKKCSTGFTRTTMPAQVGFEVFQDERVSRMLAYSVHAGKQMITLQTEARQEAGLSKSKRCWDWGQQRNRRENRNPEVIYSLEQTVDGQVLIFPVTFTFGKWVVAFKTGGHVMTQIQRQIYEVAHSSLSA